MTGSLKASSRLAALLLAAFAFVATGLLAPVGASAQEREKPRNLFQFLFGGDRSDNRKAAPGANSKARSKGVRKAKPAEPEVVAIEKSPTAKVVLVVGDFMAAGLAEGLVEVYAQNPEVRVVERSNGSSGFVRPDFHDWPTEVQALIETEKPAAVIVMLGSNDRQQMTIGETREQPMTDPWIKEYTVRSEAFGNTVRTGRVPLLWVGMPAFKSKKMTSDMLALNDVYRAAAQATGGEFVDIWDGFVDEAGVYVQTGPDINGQPVRLRAGDGINLTKAGKRKVAFYTEKPLAKLLGTAAGSGARATPQFLGAGVTPVDPLSIDRTVPVSLMDPELDGGMELLGGLAVGQKTGARTPGEKLSIEGIAPKAAPGRADDFSGQAPPEPVAPDSTTAIVR